MTAWNAETCSKCDYEAYIQTWIETTESRWPLLWTSDRGISSPRVNVINPFASSLSRCFEINSLCGHKQFHYTTHILLPVPFLQDPRTGRSRQATICKWFDASRTSFQESTQPFSCIDWSRGTPGQAHFLFARERALTTFSLRQTTLITRTSLGQVLSD